jgi:iron-sulfur cluster assembly accessory protein
MRRHFALLAVVVFASGCVQNESTSQPDPDRSQPTEPAQPPEPPLISVTPAATAELRNAAAEFGAGNTWWVRLTVKGGGCTGFQSNLDLDVEGVQAADHETAFDGVRILYRADQEFLVQGAVIDFIKTEERTGFSVTYPNQTDWNRERTKAWVQAELDARLHQLKEQDK